MMPVLAGQAPDWLNVSRETLDRLTAYLALIEKWNPAINLIAKGSLPGAWERHILDSAQLMLLCPADARKWVDFGSGGGLPGIVIAIIAEELRPDVSMTLVESDKRKATFLTQAARQLNLTIAVLATRSETLKPTDADVISARAFAPLTDLCSLAHRHLSPTGTAIFPKGAQAEAELAAARKLWQFNAQAVPSLTDPAGRILTMKNIRHV